MSNMSYCRFENTSNDLNDCRNALDDIWNSERRKLSSQERDAAIELATTCADILARLAEARGAIITVQTQDEGEIDLADMDWESAVDAVQAMAEQDADEVEEEAEEE